MAQHHSGLRSLFKRTLSHKAVLRYASGLLVRQVRFADTMVGRVPIQVDYSDYRDVAGAGVKLPFHVITTCTDGRSDVLLSSAETNVAIDAGKFNQPTPPASRKQ